MEQKILIQSVDIIKFKKNQRTAVMDDVMIEEPLQINTISKDLGKKPSSITMRTPGHDDELALGFMFNEGIINEARDIVKTTVGDGEVNLYFNDHISADTKDTERNFYITSSCGVCGKSSIDALKMHSEPKMVNKLFSPEIIKSMYEEIRLNQKSFVLTGGSHSAAVFNYEGKLIVLREDVGRHNAVDKCAGYLFKNGLLASDEYILCLSGRSCYELIQKAVRMNCTTIISIGAATSLAIETAFQFNVTLIGFFKDTGYNIYNGQERQI